MGGGYTTTTFGTPVGPVGDGGVTSLLRKVGRGNLITVSPGPPLNPESGGESPLFVGGERRCVSQSLSVYPSSLLRREGEGRSLNST